MYDPRPASRHLFAQKPDPIAEPGEMRFVKRLIKPVIHPVAGEYKFGLGLRKHPIQPFMKCRTREAAIAMSGLGESGDRLAGKPHIDDFKLAIWKPRQEKRFEMVHQLSGIGDTVSKKQDAANLGKRMVGRAQPRGGACAKKQGA